MKKTEKGSGKNVPTNGVLVEKLTLKVLGERHNALARYLGVPCPVSPDEIMQGAAMADGTVKHEDKYACYRVDLGHYKGDFEKVRFHAVTNGEDVAFGYLVDKNGEVHALSADDGFAGEAHVVAALTEDSKTLFANMPLVDGKPAWEDVEVELLCPGVIDNTNEALNCLLKKINSLEARVEALATPEKSDTAVCSC